MLDWDGVTDDLRQNVRWSGSSRHRQKKSRRKCKREGAYCIYHFEVREGGRWERDRAYRWKNGGGRGGEMRRWEREVEAEVR